MIHSFKLEYITVNTDLIKRIKQTRDVELQLQMVIQDKVSPNIHGDMDKTCNKDEEDAHENPVFTETLQDTLVYVGDPVILTCKLNVSENAVTWRHDYKPVEETETLKFLTDKCTHWLAISRAKLSDAGQYFCDCGKSSTKGVLKVLEKRLEIVKHLHVDTIESDVRENMDIVLICAVNLRTNEVEWRHDGDEIKSCNRHLTSVNVLEHRLTIKKAQFEDEGDYTVYFRGVSSNAKLTIIRDNINLSQKKELMENQSENWFRGALGLKYLKCGLEGFTDGTVTAHHNEILSQFPHTVKVCTNCTSEVLLPWHKKDVCHKKHACLCSKKSRMRKLCPNFAGFCSKLYDSILWDHQFFDPMLASTDIQKWSFYPWSVATYYINTPRYNSKTSARQVDCAGVLSLFINNCFFERSLDETDLNDKTDLFKKARDARNDILHSANCELSDSQLYGYIDLFKSVLEIKNRNEGSNFFNQPDALDAIDKLNEVRQQIDIQNSDDLIQDLLEHGMDELADKVAEAENQYYIKVKLLEDPLTHKEEELQLMLAFRSAHIKRTDLKDPKVPFQLELHIRVIGLSVDTIAEGRRYLRNSMKDFEVINNHDKPDVPMNFCRSTDQSVNRILGYISNIKGCKIEVLKTKRPAVKIRCFTCDAVEEFLKYINGNELQKETQVLKKCLQTKEKIKAYDVIASCSSESIDNTRKCLRNGGITTDLTCGIHQGTQCTWYCSDHEKFFCSTCKDSDHRLCVGIKQVVSERSYRKQNRSLVVKRKIGRYNLRIRNFLVGRDDSDDNDCKISSICLLPDGNILLTDYKNNKLKKLDNSYKIVSHLPFDSFERFGMCYIGNDTAVVCYVSGRIQYVNVSGKMKLEHDVHLDHQCHGLACHGDTLYVRGGDAVYTYNRDCREKHILCNIQYTCLYFSHIAVSDGGELIYITDGRKGLITIDNKGNHLFTFKPEVWYEILDVCVVGDGTVLIVDSLIGVHQVDYSGKQGLGTVINTSHGLRTPCVSCFDRQRCRLIVAEDCGNCISVFKLKRHNSDTHAMNSQSNTTILYVRSSEL